MRRGCLFLLVLLLALAAGGVVVADRLAARLAAKASDVALSRQGVRDAHVHYEGFPFLTQLLHKHFGEVAVTASSLQHGGLTVGAVDLVLHDVRPDPGGAGAAASQSLSVGSLSGTVALPYSSIEAKAGLPAGTLSTAGDGVRVARTLSVLGYDVPVSGVGTVEIEGTDVIINPQHVSLPGGVGDAIATAVARQIRVRYPIAGLPAGLRVTGVRPTATGLSAAVSGERVVLRP